MPRRILADGLEWDRRAAVVGDDGRLLAYFNDPWEGSGGNPPLRPGAVVAARVVQVFADRGRIAAEFDGQPLSIRLGRRTPPAPGSVVVATVTADPRESKPPQLRLGVVVDAARPEAGELAGLESSPPSKPALIENGPDAIGAARAAFPDAELVEAASSDWDDADIDIQLEAALEPRLALPDGGVLHINTPPGAAVFDGDSGEGGLAPAALAEAMAPEVARSLVLRRIGGPVVVDFPRLDAGLRKSIHEGMKAALAIDPLDVQCHGFGPGGLYAVTRPWRWRPLADLLEPTPARLGLDALRLVLGVSRGHGTAPEIVVPAAAHDWLHGDGRELLAAVLKPLAIKPRFRSDDQTERPQLAGRPR